MGVRLKPYPEYKDSGVAWLGEIPEHWSANRLKRVCRLGYGDSLPSEVRLSGDVPVYGSNGCVGHHNTSNTLGPCIIIGRKGSFGKVNYSAEPAFAIDTTFFVDARLTKECLRCLYYVLSWARLDDASRDSAVPGLDRGEAYERIVPTAPIEEQHQIAVFLDSQNYLINRLIRAKRKLIELLNKQKQAIIHRAVTRGLNPNVRLKPSGIDWLGDVPEHWEIAGLRMRYSVQLGKMLDAKRITGSHLVPYLRNTDVQWDRVNTSDLPMMDIREDEYPRYTVQPGDLLVCEGGEVGRAAFWDGSLSICGYQKALHRLRPTRASHDFPRFLFYVLFSVSKRGVFVADGSENTIAHLTAEKLRRYRFAFPPRNEQETITNYLDTTLTELKRAVEKADREIDLLHEYCTRLIADVVTGKLDVRGVELPALNAGDDLDDLDDNEETAWEESEETEETTDVDMR